jgi:hypothetical protein
VCAQTQQCQLASWNQASCCDPGPCWAQLLLLRLLLPLPYLLFRLYPLLLLLLVVYSWWLLLLWLPRLLLLLRRCLLRHCLAPAA